MRLGKYLHDPWRLVLLTIPLAANHLTAGPTTGAHTLAFYPCGGTGKLSTPAINTQPSGSTILAWVGRGILTDFIPSTVPIDNLGNTYTLLGSIHDYSPLYPPSGEALFVATAATGGSGQVITAPLTGTDEITLAVVEVENGGVIQDAQWNKVLAPPHTSLNVTTTGPATLVAIWCGDSGSPSVTATPNNGFAITDSQLLSGCDVEVVVATRDVAVAGTYNVTWTATPTQGAHLYLVAVQSAVPALQAQVSASNLALSWPTSAIGYNLQMTSNLTPTNAWTTVTNAPVIIGPQNVVTNPISPGNRFFRLKNNQP